jgi:hypothetical protein
MLLKCWMFPEWVLYVPWMFNVPWMDAEYTPNVSWTGRALKERWMLPRMFPWWALNGPLMFLEWTFNMFTECIPWMCLLDAPWMGPDLTVFPKCVPRMFPERSSNVPWKFRERSLNVPQMFPESSLNVPWMFSERSYNVSGMFPKCSLKVPWTFPEHSPNAPRMFPESALNVPRRYLESSLNVPRMFVWSC